MAASLPGRLVALTGSNKLTELGAGVDGCLGGVVGGQVLQVLLPGPGRHRDELIRPVSSVLRIDNLRQEELGEGGVLREEGGGGNGRTKHRDVL